MTAAWIAAFDTRVQELSARGEDLRRQERKPGVDLERLRRELELARDWVALYEEFGAARAAAAEFSSVLVTVIAHARSHQERRADLYEDLLASAEARAARKAARS